MSYTNNIGLCHVEIYCLIFLKHEVCSGSINSLIFSNTSSCSQVYYSVVCTNQTSHSSYMEFRSIFKLQSFLTRTDNLVQKKKNLICMLLHQILLNELQIGLLSVSVIHTKVKYFKYVFKNIINTSFSTT